MTERLLRLPSVKEQTGLSRSAIYAAINAGTFPPPLKVSERAVAWTQSSIDSWIETRIAANKEAS